MVTTIGSSPARKAAVTKPKLVSDLRIIDGVAAARVEWETDLPTLGKIELVGSESTDLLHDDDGIRRNHKVTLVDLLPGETYKVRVKGPDGPLGKAVTFTARGVSIAFNPLFTSSGLELHWTSEDPLVLREGQESDCILMGGTKSPI